MSARKLRKAMTLPEVLLWQRLRGAKTGVKFRRQHPVGPYVVDFFCREAKLIVEVDGAIHDHDRSGDAVRDAFLIGNGFYVLRLNAGDVIRDPDGIAESIACAVSPLHHAAHGPPPRTGEELL